jgi:hypothetical protein
MRSVTEEQRSRSHARAQPAGLRIFDAAPTLLVAHRSIKNMLAPRALAQRQIASNALTPIYEIGSTVR